jgi:hypothetical protein
VFRLACIYDPTLRLHGGDRCRGALLARLAGPDRAEQALDVDGQKDAILALER